MKRKVCTKCYVEQDISNFNKDKKQKSGRISQCKNCKKLYDIQYYQINKNDKLEHQKIYASNNKEKISIYINEYQSRNKEELSAKNKIRRETNIEKYRLRDKLYLQKYYKDPIFRIKLALRRAAKRLLFGKIKHVSTIKSLGCTIEHFIKQFETMFYNHPLTNEKMTWNNYGKGVDKWHIDHIIPLVSFNLADKEQYLKACHYTNLQPLWEIDNLKKGTKLNWIK